MIYNLKYILSTKIHLYVKNQFFYYFVAVLLKLLQYYSDYVNSDDFIGNNSSMSIRNNPNLFETIIFGPMKIKFNVKTL